MRDRESSPRLGRSSGEGGPCERFSGQGREPAPGKGALKGRGLRTPRGGGGPEGTEQAVRGGGEAEGEVKGQAVSEGAGGKRGGVQET